MKNLLIAVVGIGIALNFLPSFAFAYGYGYGDAEAPHLLTVGAGIADPSVTAALGENPAGLTNNSHFRILGDAFTDSHSFNPMGYGGNLYFGNGFAGGGVGVQYNGFQPVFSAGVAAVIPTIDTSIGIDGTYTSFQGIVSWNTDVGVIINTHGIFRVGLSAFGLVGGVHSFGAGVAAAFSESALFAVDGSINRNGTGATVKPGLGINVSDLQMSLGYGLQIDKNNLSWIKTGASVGLGLRASQTIHMQFYYNQIDQYFFGLTFKI